MANNNKLGYTIHDTITKLEDLYIEKKFDEVAINGSSILLKNHEALLILANCYLALGNREKDALEVLLDMENNHFSNNGKIKNLIATIYWKLGDEENAYLYLQQAIAYEPHLADAKFNLEDILEWEPRHYNTLVHLGVLEAKNNDFDLAAEYFKRARNVKNTDLKVTYNLANIHLKKGRYEEAIPLFEEALEHEKENVKMMQKLMVCYGKSDTFEKLEQICKKILALDKTNVKAVAYLSRALKENNKLSQLEKLLTKIDNKMEKFANKTNKKDVVVKIKTKLKEKLEEVKNLMFMGTNDSDKESDDDKDLPAVSITKLESVDDPNIKKHQENLLKNPLDKEALFYLANNAYKNNDTEIAFSYYTKLTEIDGKYYEDEVVEKMGYIHFKNKRWKEAIECFEKINNKRARDIISLKIGRCYEKLKLFTEAFFYYKKSLEITKEFLWGLFYLGSLFIRTGRREEGMKYLKLAVDKNSQNSEIIIKYCEELLKDNDEVDTVINVLTKSLDAISENSEILVLLARAHEYKGNYAKAVEVLEEAMILKDFNTNPTKMFQLGLLYEKAMNFNKAISLYKSILNINKEHIPSLCHLASILSHAKEFKRAMKYFKYALALDEKLAFAHFGVGKIYQASNQPAEAMKCFYKCLEHDSKYYKAYFQIGLLKLDSNEIEAAKENFEKCLLLNSDYTLAIIGLGNVYYEEGDFHKAEEFHRRALRIDPKDLQAIISLAYSLSGQKYKRALEIDSELADVHYNMGNAYYMLEKYDEAMKFYIKSVKIDENRPEVFYNLGNAFCIKENFKDAIRCYKKSIKLDPKNYETHFNLGNSYFVIGWYKEALECYTMASTLGYENTDLKFAFARVYIELGTDSDVKEAERYLFDLLKNDPNNNKYLFYYAKLKEFTNKREARQIYKKIIESHNYVESELPQAKENYMRLLEEMSGIELKI